MKPPSKVLRICAPNDDDANLPQASCWRSRRGLEARIPVTK
jgi:hypothetical protein